MNDFDIVNIWDNLKKSQRKINLLNGYIRVMSYWFFFTIFRFFGKARAVLWLPVSLSLIGSLSATLY